ncbi:hypothetical protein GCM10010390_17340 [Streptomyces mordarskii]|uniref:FAD-binding domain-containing protein n=1 Tax=Streptomyces mordarskii TaxID=1226758 RepID=A0ABN1CB55_9ACTN
MLLAGDAAHVHSPFGGQGLNLGVGDAMNLGWKLGAVIAGWAPEGLLGTYDAERRPLGAWVLDWTRAQIGVMRGDATSAALREVVADLLSTREGTTYAVKKISGVTQRVDLPGDHPLIGRYVPDLRLRDGSRLADHGHGGGFLLLDRSPDGAFARLAAAWAGLGAQRGRRPRDADRGVGTPGRGGRLGLRHHRPRHRHRPRSRPAPMVRRADVLTRARAGGAGGAGGAAVVRPANPSRTGLVAGHRAGNLLATWRGVRWAWPLTAR